MEIEPPEPPELICSGALEAHCCIQIRYLEQFIERIASSVKRQSFMVLRCVGGCRELGYDSGDNYLFGVVEPGSSIEVAEDQAIELATLQVENVQRRQELIDASSSVTSLWQFRPLL